MLGKAEHQVTDAKSVLATDKTTTEQKQPCPAEINPELSNTESETSITCSCLQTEEKPVQEVGMSIMSSGDQPNSQGLKSDSDLEGGQTTDKVTPSSERKLSCTDERHQCDAMTSQCAQPVMTSAVSRIDHALHKLKSELVAMREQDLELLKQLIHINDNIRRLKRTRWLQSAGRTSSCGVLGARGGTAPPHGTVPGVRDGTSLLHRQRSEPGMTLLPRRASVLTSASSIDTIADLEEVDSLYGSATDLDEVKSPTVAMATPTGMRRSSSAFAALTFTPEELTSGDSSYGEILKRNVRLWKWSVAREKDTGMEGQLLSCVL